MTMTAAEICEEVYGLSGFESLEGFQGSPDPDDRLIFFLLRQAIRDIGKYKWQVLVRTGEITFLQGASSAALPEDFREFIFDSVYAYNDVRRVDFPASFPQWGRIESQVGPTGIARRIQIRESQLRRLTEEGDEYRIRFDYISDHPVIDPDTNEGKKTVTKDNDVVLLDEDLMIKAVKAKWSLEKGLDTLQADMNAFDFYLKELRGTDRNAQTISFVRSPLYYPPPPYTNTWK